MSQQTVNLSANEVLEHLQLKLPSNWTSEANEIDTVCINTPAYELGWIVQLVISNSTSYSFAVHEFQYHKDSGVDCEQDDSFASYDSALDHIARRIETFKV